EIRRHITDPQLLIGILKTGLMAMRHGAGMVPDPFLASMRDLSRACLRMQKQSRDDALLRGRMVRLPQPSPLEGGERLVQPCHGLQTVAQIETERRLFGSRFQKRLEQSAGFPGSSFRNKQIAQLVC